jgi:hypothetical protein
MPATSGKAQSDERQQLVVVSRGEMLGLLRSASLHIDARDWIALAALVVATLSALTSLSSRRLAGRAYRLSLDANRRAQPSFELYLIDGKIRPLVEPARRVCLLMLRITNQSDSSNGIRELKLKVDCRKSNQPATNFIVHHDASYATGGDGSVLAVPQAMTSRAVVSGMAVFPIPEQLIQGAYVESHTIILTDSYGEQIEHEVLFLREERDARREGH